MTLCLVTPAGSGVTVVKTLVFDILLFEDVLRACFRTVVVWQSVLGVKTGMDGDVRSKRRVPPSLTKSSRIAREDKSLKLSVRVRAVWTPRNRPTHARRLRHRPLNRPVTKLLTKLRTMAQLWRQSQMDGIIPKQNRRCLSLSSSSFQHGKG